jgi:hypothetical protein
VGLEGVNGCEVVTSVSKGSNFTQLNTINKIDELSRLFNNQIAM